MKDSFKNNRKGVEKIKYGVKSKSSVGLFLSSASSMRLSSEADSKKQGCGDCLKKQLRTIKKCIENIKNKL